MANLKILKSKTATSEDLAQVFNEVESQESEINDKLNSVHSQIISLHKAALMGESIDKSVKKIHSQERDLRGELEALGEIKAEVKTKLFERLQQERTGCIAALQAEIVRIREDKRAWEKKRVSAFAYLDSIIEIISGVNALSTAGRFELPDDNILFRDEVAKFRKELNPEAKSSLKAQRTAIDVELKRLTEKSLDEADVERFIDQERQKK